MHGKDGITREFLKGVTRGLQERKVGRRGGDGGKIKWKLSEVNTRTVSRGQNELIGKFKMAVGNVISIRKQVMEYVYITCRHLELAYQFILSSRHSPGINFR